MPIEVVALRRYPVKSLQGEPLETAIVGAQGLEGDRAWGIVDAGTGLVLTARREPRLLLATPKLGAAPDARPAIELPDGALAEDDDALSAWLARPVRLVRAIDHGRGTYETPTDAEHEADGPWVSWHGPTGTFHDSARTQLSIASTAAIGPWDERRFRQNVVVRVTGTDAAVSEPPDSPEFALVGARLALGGATVDIVKRIDRCVMTTRAQPGGIERDLDVLRTITRERGGDLGVGALVVTPGEVRVGDTVTTIATIASGEER